MLGSVRCDGYRCKPLSANCFADKGRLLSCFSSAFDEKKALALSHTAVNRKVLCGHTHNPGRAYLSAKHLSPLSTKGLWAFVSMSDLQPWLRIVQ